MQQSLFDPSHDAKDRKTQPVTCLGLAFPSEEARREHFTELLRQRLKDPEFRKIEGFPLGEDEAILNLSDPPYYTACPNPWIADFVAEWEAQKPPKPEGYVYHRDPFAADVSEGKKDPLYLAHSYHTKVPHQAIMRYLLHFTDPGDVVFDGFCGSGMTGLAAQMCGQRDAVMALGYQVQPGGTILRSERGDAGATTWHPFTRLGARKAILNDLSPAATSIANNYNTPADLVAFQIEARRILDEVECEIGWMYETLHTDSKTVGQIDYVVWSEVFSCPECGGELVFLEEAFDSESNKVLLEYPCPKCRAIVSKKKTTRVLESYFDPILGIAAQRPKRRILQIHYRVSGEKFSKPPEAGDLEILERIEALPVPASVPKAAYPYDDMWDAPRMLSRGITHVHHLFLPRQLHLFDLLWRKMRAARSARMRSILSYWLDQSIPGLSVFNRFVPTHFSQVNQHMSGVCYVPSQISECSPWYNLSGKITRLTKALGRANVCLSNFVAGTNSSQATKTQDCSVDYIFIDPPFGDNFPYAELNFLTEAWLGVFTDMKPEAIVERSKKNRDSQKGLQEYRELMTACFREAYRVLKPGRWMTVEFSNTKASVWNAIQTALSDAGFIVANVSGLDKKQLGFKALSNPTAVKQDLVISAYKPNGGFEERFQRTALTEDGVWDFIRTHLGYLPVAKMQLGALQFVPERDPRILFDQMVAFYVRHGFPVPLSSQEFQAGLAQRFLERDGMYFLPDQVAEYDRKKMVSGQPTQMSLFVSDEASAIQWLRQVVHEKPQAFSDINPLFMKQLGGWSKNEAQLDLRVLLDQNFLCYDGRGPVPEQIHAYLSSNWREFRNLAKDDPALVAKARDRWYVPDPNKAGDLEKLREKALLKEFEEYRQSRKKLKVFRLESVRAGFKRAWQERDYTTIVSVAEKLPANVLEEDPKLLMFYDQATTRLGAE